MNIFNKIACMIMGHRLHSEVTINDMGVATSYHHLVTCKNCGKLFSYRNEFIEKKEIEIPVKSCCDSR